MNFPLSLYKLLPAWHQQVSSLVINHARDAINASGRYSVVHKVEKKCMVVLSATNNKCFLYVLWTSTKTKSEKEPLNQACCLAFCHTVQSLLRSFEGESCLIVSLSLMSVPLAMRQCPPSCRQPDLLMQLTHTSLQTNQAY